MIYTDLNGEVMVQFNPELTSIERKGVIQCLTKVVNVENEIMVKANLEDE